MNDSLKIAFPVTREQQLEIENVCTEEGKTFADYFLGMHREHMGDIRKFSKTDLDNAVKQALEKSKCKVDNSSFDDIEEETSPEAEEEVEFLAPKKRGRPKKEY